MADTKSATERDAARNRAQQFFTASEQRDAEVKQMIEGERAATDAKTAKLRALRLEKEEAERAAAATQSPVDPAPVRARRSRK
ncbi:MAG TPA: hypothetical protein VN154_08320 [Rhizomicrobium sp.]|nr:hypothetical protein [Rhizomicrobium sp.]